MTCRGGLVAFLGLVALAGCDREGAMEHISRLEDARSTGRGALVAYLVDPSGGVRAYAARAAGRVGDPRLVVGLAGALLDPDPTVVREAAFSLGQIALAQPEIRPQVADLLSARLGGGAVLPPQVHAEVVAALGKTGDAAPVSRVVAALGDEEVRVRRGALLAATRLGEAIPVEPVLARLHDPDPENRWRAAIALRDRHDPVVTASLIERLEDGSPRVRRMACRALANRPQPSVVAALTARLQGREWDRGVLAEMITALARVGGTDAYATLAPFVHSVFPEVRGAMTVAMARGDDAVPVDDLLMLARDRRAVLRLRMVPVLDVHPTPEATDALEELSRDPVSEVRAAASVALARRTSPTALVALVDDPNPDVRAGAIRALGEPGPSDVVPVLRRGLGDANPEVAAASAEALTILLSRRSGDGQHGEGPVSTKGWVSEVYSAAASPEVKRALLAGFTRLPDRDPCELLPLLRDPDDGVRRAAYELLERGVNRNGSVGCEVPPRRQVWTLERPLSAAAPRVRLESLPRQCTFVTTAGEISVDLARREAPRSVDHLAWLARTGALESVGFRELVDGERIVVRSAGEPLDASAGLRDEVNPIRLTWGSLVLLGEDADVGGRCLMFALAPLPELDGHHTVMGEVVLGLDVLQLLDLDDRILRIVVG
jgi:HEAT repeat protein/cyclophilin family peptidyl-prolyl cis-trans isomerase